MVVSALALVSVIVQEVGVNGEVEVSASVRVSPSSRGKVSECMCTVKPDLFVVVSV